MVVRHCHSVAAVPRPQFGSGVHPCRLTSLVGDRVVFAAEPVEANRGTENSERLDASPRLKSMVSFNKKRVALITLCA